jgi:RsiW-degrading membrane proteinase PrsW (M82 family)
MGLSILLLSLLPAVAYIFIIYLTVPYKTINLKTAFVYLVVGFMSVGLLKYFWILYPDWHLIAEFTSGTNVALDPFTYFHHFYFVQVGLIEEIAKLGIFLMIDRYRRRNQDYNDHPLAIMFYMAMVSLGFAVIENVQYGLIYGDSVLYWRSFTATIGHMVFGLFMGYWIAMGRMGKRFFDRSLFDIVINKREKLRNFVYTFIGLGAATILHGIYNLHMQFNGKEGITGTYMLLVFSVLGAYWCFRNLTQVYDKKQEEERSS